jgi:hypothetical protein
LDYYLAVAHGGAAAHPTRHQRIQESRSGQVGRESEDLMLVKHRNESSQDSLSELENSFNSVEGGGGGGGGNLHVHPVNHDFKKQGGSHHAMSAQDAKREAVAQATLEVIRFDRRVPMRDRWRQAGDNPAWRGFVPQWTSELGAHRVWRNKLGQRSRMLNEFNTIVAGGSEKPPQLEEMAS